VSTAPSAGLAGSVSAREFRPRWGVTFLALGLFALLAVAGLLLRTDAAPLGLVSLQFAGDVGRAADILAAWDGELWRRAVVLQGLDLLLPFAYGVALVRWARHLGPLDGSADRGVVTFAVSLAVFAAVADQAENVALLVTMLHRPSSVIVGLTPVLASTKFVSLTAALFGVALLRSRTASREGR